MHLSPWILGTEEENYIFKHPFLTAMLFMFEFLSRWKKYSVRMKTSYPNNHKIFSS